MIKAVVFDYNEVINRRLRLQPELLDLAKQLRKDGIKTAILSNIIMPLAWFIKLRGKMADFEPIVFAYEIGASKPDTKSYEFIIKKLGLKPQECLFVDNRAENIAGAEAVGMHVVMDHDTAQTIEDIKLLLKATR